MDGSCTNPSGSKFSAKIPEDLFPSGDLNDLGRSDYKATGDGTSGLPEPIAAAKIGSKSWKKTNGLKILSKPASTATVAKSRHDHHMQHHALWIDPERQRQILVVGIGAHGPMRVRLRNQNSNTTAILATTTVIPCVVLIARPSRVGLLVGRFAHRDDEAFTIGEFLVIRPDDKAHQAVHDEDDTHGYDHKDHGLGLLFAVKPIDQTVRDQNQSDTAKGSRGWSQKRGRQCQAIPTDWNQKVKSTASIPSKAMVSP